jgi:acyl transferase domain-containing protein/SAM-dependent methyltransferase/acyl carrier protein
VAVVSLAARFPGAPDVATFWANLCAGAESITRFTADEMVGLGRDPAMVRQPNFVGAEGVLESIDRFDAAYFGFTPRQAEVMDPQHRVCLEVAWEALVDGGYRPGEVAVPVGVFLSSSMSSYLIRNLLPNQRVLDLVGGFSVLIHNDKDFLATTVSHKLGLTGPSLAVGTACSSSLVAVHLACQSLLAHECDMALAGGVSLQVPQPQGYLFRDDGIYSPDGHCRAFGAGSQGTVGGSGAGVVLLKRWQDAQRDGDLVHALIVGTAVNNDGAARAGYTAPGVDGQTAVIAEALTVAGITGAAVGYIEAHGTGTKLGDAIEIEALTRAFGPDAGRESCAVGSVKTNIGHLDAAAGIAGFIKAVLAVEHGTIPASLHCGQTSLDIDFANTPFLPAATTRSWPASDGPRHAGVSAFGIGGTNAHVVLRQAPPSQAATAMRPRRPAELSPQRYWIDPPPPAAVGAATDLGTLVAQLPSLPDGSVSFDRESAVELDRLCAVLALRYLASAGVDITVGARHTVNDLRRRLQLLPQFHRFLDFMLGMLVDDGVVTRADDAEPTMEFVRYVDTATVAATADGIGRRIPRDRGAVDLLVHCADRYAMALSTPGAALATLYPDGGGGLLQQMLGEDSAQDAHAPTIATLVRLAELIAGATGRPLRILEVGVGGGRLTWSLATALQPSNVDYLATDVSRVFVNHVADEAARRELVLRTGLLDISRDPMTQGFADASFDLIVGLDVVHATPDVRASLANLAGLVAPGGVLALVETTAKHRWLSMVWGLSKGWWSFADGVRDTMPLLTGEGWARVLDDLRLGRSMVLPRDGDSTLALLQVPGSLNRSEPPAQAPDDLISLPPKRPDLADWCYVPSWRRVPALSGATTEPARCIAFTDGAFGDVVVDQLRARGHDVTVVRPPTGQPREGERTVDLDSYRELWEEVSRGGERPRLVVHLWHAEPVSAEQTPPRLTPEEARQAQERGLHSVLALARAVGQCADSGPVRLLVATTAALDVLGSDLHHPEQSTVHAAATVIPRENPDLACRVVDLPPVAAGAYRTGLVSRLVDEILTPSYGPDCEIVAYRGDHRWTRTYLPAPVPEAGASALRPGGVYLVCGGLGGIGLGLAGCLAGLPATVVLTGRSAFPDREHWRSWLEEHDIDDETSAVIRRLLAAEAGGGTVVVERADVTRPDQMNELVGRIVARHGPITGVVHAAGVADAAGMIQRRDRADTDAAINAKLVGTVVLEQALAAQRPDFILLCSSIGTVLPKLKFGEVGYLAGHEFLNNYAAHAAARGLPVMAVAWTDWLETGMWARAQRQLVQRYSITGAAPVRPDEDLLRGITTAEGAQLFQRLVSARVASQVVVSTQALDRMLTLHEAYSTDTHRKAIAGLVAAGRDRIRPDLASPYAKPDDGLQSMIVQIWEELLGIDGIGATDDFFELGGDSLLALRFLSRLRDETGVDHPMTRFFNAATAGAVAADVLAHTGGFEEVVI